jgi:hypothetical protein
MISKYIYTVVGTIIKSNTKILVRIVGQFSEFSEI